MRLYTVLYYIGHMSESPVTTTLGTQIKRRRDELNLSQSAAARNAGVARSTWVAWEKGTSVPESFNHALIERVMRWEPGSIAAGGEPTPLPSGAPAAVSDVPPDDAFVREMRAANVSDEVRDAVIRAYWADKAREEQQLQRKYRDIIRAAEG